MNKPERRKKNMIHALIVPSHLRHACLWCSKCCAEREQKQHSCTIIITTHATARSCMIHISNPSFIWRDNWMNENIEFILVGRLLLATLKSVYASRKLDLNPLACANSKIESELFSIQIITIEFRCVQCGTTLTHLYIYRSIYVAESSLDYAQQGISGHTSGSLSIVICGGIREDIKLHLCIHAFIYLAGTQHTAQHNAMRAG